MSNTNISACILFLFSCLLQNVCSAAYPGIVLSTDPQHGTQTELTNATNSCHSVSHLKDPSFHPHKPVTLDKEASLEKEPKRLDPTKEASSVETSQASGQHNNTTRRSGVSFDHTSSNGSDKVSPRKDNNINCSGKFGTVLVCVNLA